MLKWVLLPVYSLRWINVVIWEVEAKKDMNHIFYGK